MKTIYLSNERMELYNSLETKLKIDVLQDYIDLVQFWSNGVLIRLSNGLIVEMDYPIDDVIKVFKVLFKHPVQINITHETYDEEIFDDISMVNAQKLLKLVTFAII